MIKKVKTTDLKAGMFIHDLNVPWMEHDFASSTFLIQNDKQIEKIIKQNISEVLIDTEKGLDDAHAPTKEEAESALMEKIIDIASAPADEPPPPKHEPQWVESKQIHAEAVKLVSGIMNDVRLGKQVSIEQAGPIVENIADAVLQNDGTLLSLCRIKQSDTYTFQHSVSVSALLITFCHAIGGFSEGDLYAVGMGGLFHDIGKMKTPNEILNKPGRLTETEFSIMKTHVDEGVDYLMAGPALSKPTMRIVAEHHERFNGSGYPRGLARNAISLLGQMASIVDVYDAITSTRIYHAPLEPISAMQLIFEWSGKHFDASLVQTFIKGIGIYPVGSLVRLESRLLAVVLRQAEGNLLQPLVRVIFDTKSKHKLPPKDLDLAAPGCQDSIAGYEVPSAWGIDPLQFIGKSI